MAACARSRIGHRPLIVNFWATWCEPCRREMPLLTALRQEHRADRLEIVGIAVDFRDSVTDFLKKNPLPYPLLVGEEDGIEAAKAFGMQLVLPFSVFVDEQRPHRRGQGGRAAPGRGGLHTRHDALARRAIS